MIRIETVTLPAFLAPALINGDESGLDEVGLRVLNEVYAYLGELRVVSDVEDSERFTWNYRLLCGDADGGNVADFICHASEP